MSGTGPFQMGNCCDCNTPPPCQTGNLAVRANIYLPGGGDLNPQGSFSWPGGGDTFLLVQNTYAPYGATADLTGGDPRAPNRYLQIDDVWSSSTGAPGFPTENATATRTRTFDPDTGQLTSFVVAVTSTSGTNASGSWSLDTSTGNVSTSGADPFDLWANHNAVIQASVSATFGTDVNSTATINVGLTGFDYTFSGTSPDGSFTNGARKVTMSNPITLNALMGNTINMLATIDLTNPAALYTFDDGTTHAIAEFTALYWVKSTYFPDPVHGKFIAIHDPGAGWQNTEKSVYTGLTQAAKRRIHVCANYNKFSQELTIPIPDSSAPGSPDNGSFQHLSGVTDCVINFALANTDVYLNPSDIPFTWGFAQIGGC